MVCVTLRTYFSLLTANLDLNLDNLEFSALPSGLHLVEQDVVYVYWLLRVPLTHGCVQLLYERRPTWRVYISQAQDGGAGPSRVSTLVSWYFAREITKAETMETHSSSEEADNDYIFPFREFGRVGANRE